MSRRRNVIDRGQLIRPVGSRGDLWEVVEVRSRTTGGAHAQLRKVNEPKTLKTLSLSVLYDESRFEIMMPSDPSGMVSA